MIIIDAYMADYCARQINIWLDTKMEKPLDPTILENFTKSIAYLIQNKYSYGDEIEYLLSRLNAWYTYDDHTDFNVNRHAFDQGAVYGALKVYKYLYEDEHYGEEDQEM